MTSEPVKSAPLVWRLMTFSEPPPEAQMKRTKAGNVWFRIFTIRDAVLPVARLLRAASVKFKCDKVPAPYQPRPRGNVGDVPASVARIRNATYRPHEMIARKPPTFRSNKRRK